MDRQRQEKATCVHSPSRTDCGRLAKRTKRHHQKRNVRFNDRDQVVGTVDRLKDLTEEEVRSAWFRREEYTDLIWECSVTLTMSKCEKKRHLVDDVLLCSRGLLDRETLKTRQEERDFVNKLLLLQFRSDNGNRQDGMISQLYHKCSTASTKRAREDALRDEHDSKCYAEQDEKCTPKETMGLDFTQAENRAAIEELITTELEKSDHHDETEEELKMALHRLNKRRRREQEESKRKMEEMILLEQLRQLADVYNSPSLSLEEKAAVKQAAASLLQDPSGSRSEQASLQQVGPALSNADSAKAAVQQSSEAILQDPPGSRIQQPNLQRVEDSLRDEHDSKCYAEQDEKCTPQTTMGLDFTQAENRAAIEELITTELEKSDHHETEEELKMALHRLNKRRRREQEESKRKMEEMILLEQLRQLADVYNNPSLSPEEKAAVKQAAASLLQDPSGSRSEEASLQQVGPALSNADSAKAAVQQSLEAILQNPPGSRIQQPNLQRVEDALRDERDSKCYAEQDEKCTPKKTMGLDFTQAENRAAIEELIATELEKSDHRDETEEELKMALHRLNKRRRRELDESKRKMEKMILLEQLRQLADVYNNPSLSPEEKAAVNQAAASLLQDPSGSRSEEASLQQVGPALSNADSAKAAVQQSLEAILQNPPGSRIQQPNLQRVEDALRDEHDSKCYAEQDEKCTPKETMGLDFTQAENRAAIEELITTELEKSDHHDETEEELKMALHRLNKRRRIEIEESKRKMEKMILLEQLRQLADVYNNPSLSPEEKAAVEQAAASLLQDPSGSRSEQASLQQVCPALSNADSAKAAVQQSSEAILQNPPGSRIQQPNLQRVDSAQPSIDSTEAPEGRARVALPHDSPGSSIQQTYLQQVNTAQSNTKAAVQQSSETILHNPPGSRIQKTSLQEIGPAESNTDSTKAADGQPRVALLHGPPGSNAQQTSLQQVRPAKTNTDSAKAVQQASASLHHHDTSGSKIAEASLEQTAPVPLCSDSSPEVQAKTLLVG